MFLSAIYTFNLNLISVVIKPQKCDWEIKNTRFKESVDDAVK